MGEWLKDLRERLFRAGGAQRTCALCGRALKDAAPAEAGKVSGLPRYELCFRCEHQLFAQWGLPFQKYIDGLDVPVVVTDGDVVLKAANRTALALLGRKAAQLEGLRGGLVFECEHALEPEGCGRTVHCNGCVIRKCVTDTHATGTPHLRVPATLDTRAPDGAATVQLLVSTLRGDDVVLLKVEKAPAKTR